jgi:hypothetical protein
MAIMNLVTPKAGARHELLLNKLPQVSLRIFPLYTSWGSEAGLLNKGLPRALSFTIFINMRDMILVTLCCAT